MSLVAYGASDDSEASDSDEGDTVPNQEAPQLLKHYDDTPPKRTENNNNAAEKAVSIPKQADDFVTSSEDKLNGAISDEEEPVDFLKALPAPKSQPVTSSALDVTEDDELEDIVKPKPSQFSDVVKPTKKKGKGRQPVKISIPALSKDWEEEEDEPVRKKIKSSTLGSGLTSLLPAPKNLSLKETNRILLPHALKKAPPSTVGSKGKGVAKAKPAAVQRVRPAQLVSGVPDSDSDEDGESEGVSFFSLGAEAATPSTGAPYTSGPSISLRLPPVSANTGPLLPSVHTESAGTDSVCGPKLPTDSQATAIDDNYSAANHGSSLRTDTGSVPQDLPLSFRPQAGEDMPLSFKPGPSVQPQPVSYSYPQSQHPQVSYQGDGRDTAYPESGEYYPEAPGSDMEKYLQDEEFLKLQGKKQRGREQVNFIDIDTNEFTGTQDLMKTLTVEQEHTSHRKKENQPSGRQRHKHQITYLAFQAKERELTLKNQWAQNKQTKRQTQSKYGF